jgi:hypothetical protein
MAKDQSKKQCFVIGVIGEDGSPERIHADWLYDGIILPVFENMSDWVVERADRIPTPGMVSSQIINRLHDVELVIADLSFHNANAFYEMAIRHKVGKPIIHMIRKGERIPFDVIPHRAIHFAHTHPDDHKEARTKLGSAVAEAIKPGYEADNPITHAGGKLVFEQKASPEMKVLAEELAAMRARFDSVESALQAVQQNAFREPLFALRALESTTSPRSAEHKRLVELLTRPSLINETEIKPQPISSVTKSE